MLEAVEGVYAPYQFGISTLLVITAMYAVLFATLRAFRAPPSVFVVVALFFTAVGLGRRFLFKGRRPARASMIVGGCFFVGLYLVYWVVGRGYLHHPFLLAPFDPLEGALFRGNHGLSGRAADCGCVLADPHAQGPVEPTWRPGRNRLTRIIHAPIVTRSVSEGGSRSWPRLRVALAIAQACAAIPGAANNPA